MGKIKVKMNPEMPSPELISKYKNFDMFMDSYKKYYSTSGIRNMLYGDKKKLIFIVLVIIFLLLMLFASEDASLP
ncbi:MAG: hypothetical protein OEX02_18005 [Cyclobacteriaceae bacterium]|nr:hypothetical protein [Cyclobacteriaceae bacterium]